MFLSLCSEFCRVDASLNKKLPNGQLQSFDEPEDHEKIVLETVKAKLVAP